MSKKDQIPPVIIEGVEQVTNEYQKTPSKTFFGKVLRILSKFVPLIFKSIK